MRSDVLEHKLNLYTEGKTTAFDVAVKLRTLADWIKEIGAIRSVVLVVVMYVEEVVRSNGVTLPGHAKLDMAVESLRKRIGAGGWFSLMVGAVLRVLISFAVAELNSRYGRGWRDPGIMWDKK